MRGTGGIGCVVFIALAACGALLGQERINQEGRILGAAPTVAAPILFNTPEADSVVAAMQIMPITSAWNEDISRRPLLSNSSAIIAQIKSDLSSARQTLRPFYEMNYVLVPDAQPRVTIPFFNYPDESDLEGGVSPNGRYPIPSSLPIEGWPRATGNLTLSQWQQDVNNDGGDRHAIMVAPRAGAIWETWLTKRSGSTWEASNGAKFDLKSNALRPAGWTSGDAAGLPMFPALVRYDECERGMVEHALRLVVAKTRREFIYPARHYASSIASTSINYPAMGQRLRLKAAFAIPSGWTREEKAVLLALKKYGALVADNGNFFSVSVCPDDRFGDHAFDHLETVEIDNFEVIQTTGANEGPRSPGAPAVDAGTDQNIAENTATLSGSVTDPSRRATVRWQLYSGPAAVSWGDATKPATTATFSAAGNYILMLSADDGVHAVAYDAIRISVTNGAPATLLGNISTRAFIGTNESVTIGGFIISGSGSKRVLVRGLGPSLAAAGIANSLGDPVLELRNSKGALIFQNDDWKSTQATAIRNTSIAPADDREAAILATLAPGAYTTIVHGRNGGTGVGLIEVYDLDPSGTDACLFNISTRGFVGTGDDVMIAGFIVRGSGPAHLLLRGLGPSLAAAGLAQPLPDPKLDLFNAHGVRVAANNDWRSTQATAITATGLAPANAAESAIDAQLAAGNYTVILSDAGDRTGIGLVEAYTLP